MASEKGTGSLRMRFGQYQRSGYKASRQAFKWWCSCVDIQTGSPKGYQDGPKRDCWHHGDRCQNHSNNKSTGGGDDYNSEEHDQLLDHRSSSFMSIRSSQLYHSLTR